MARDVTAEAHFDYLETGLNEVVNVFADTIKFFDLDLAAIFQTDSIATIDLIRLSALAAGWAESHVRCEEWASLVKADRAVRAAGLAWIGSALASGELDPKNAHVELETAFAEACWKKAIASDPSSPPSTATGTANLSRNSSRSGSGRARPPWPAFARGIRRGSRAVPLAKCV